ncbi:hypothetical protein CK203_083646 [Vitis vinifera]|uniref:PGG domain-containing protein n=1 Tax=Vitis vinifera TaxID=29760 RepID=A0A438BSC2_VITVI|nr:hypothetical protein CK203_083646 [Vitis vinifera]
MRWIRPSRKTLLRLKRSIAIEWKLHGVLSASADKRRGCFSVVEGTMGSTSDADASDLESIRRKLMKSLASSWEEVVKIYEQDPRAHKGIKIRTILSIWGLMGSISMCRCITNECKELLGRRNGESDTPLLRAVRYGKKDVFLWLYDMCEGNTAHGYFRNEYGETILHLAIESGRMDLAFQIICKQEDLMDSVHRRGIFPLHVGKSPLDVLAEKPTAFRSGIHLGWFNKIIYHCISVEELIPAGTSKAKKNFFQELWKLIKLPGKSKKHLDPENPEEGQGIEHHGHNSSNIGAQGHKPFPSKYGRCLRFIKLLVSQVLLVIISVMPGSSQIRKLKEKKEMHIWSLQILNKLLERAARCTYEMSPKNDKADPYNYSVHSEYRYFERGQEAWGMTPILVASRNGIVEMVEKILQLFPLAIYDTDNIQHSAEGKVSFHAVDHDWNNALHLAGKLAGDHHLQHIPTSMLQMQWEVKWYQYVQNSLPPHFVVQKNRDRRTPDEIFQIQHQKLEDESKQWLNSTSNSCSFIAALIATVAFASSASIPGGVKQDTGEPVFENHLAFSIFAMASLVALCCSVISLFIFLAIFISKHQDKDFTTNLPRNFLFGLTSLFISMVAMLTCFCSGNFLMLKGQLKYAAILVYALTGLIMAYFVLKHFPLFIDLLKATFRKVPERIYKEYL